MTFMQLVVLAVFIYCAYHFGKGIVDVSLSLIIGIPWLSYLTVTGQLAEATTTPLASKTAATTPSGYKLAPLKP